LALTQVGTASAASPDKRNTQKRTKTTATTTHTTTQQRQHQKATPAIEQKPDTTLNHIMTDIRDSAIVMPESFDTGLDSMLSGWLSQHYVHIDENCTSLAEVEKVPDSVYIERLKALPTIIDMPYNQVVRSYIDMYVHRRRALVEYMVGLSHFYFPLFEDALSRYHMPTELRCLPVIESALKPSATSRVGAAGLWQFMPSTGRKMGLEVNSVLDERRDPAKSTDAACRYLLELYNIYHDWTLAIAAYNCGPGNVNKAIKRSGGKMNFWEIYFYLPQETRGYIPAFIAANYIMTYHCEHNLCGVQTDLPPVSDTVMVDHMVHFKQISTMLDVPLEEIRALNPQYAYDLVPGNYKPSALRLPAQKLYEYIEREESITAYKADSLLPKNGNYLEFVNKANQRTGSTASASGATYYVVRSGDTLSKIACKYGTSVAAIKKLNHMKSDKLTVKKRIRVK
jgi:membrane-bound lytic murein transglycosylase D